MSSRLMLAALVFASAAFVGCGADSSSDGDLENGEDALTHRARDAWFYDGPLPALESPRVAVSLKGHTVRVSGLLPAGMQAPSLPHLKSKTENGRVRVDVVYPIATGAEAGFNSRPGPYQFQVARPYRPDGITTSSHGTSFVTWGGFPFLGYNNGVALHGPITTETNGAGTDVFYLKRGPVSHGCNRMNGEHVTEVAHLVGVSMRKVWVADEIYESPSTNHAQVEVLADYDQYDGKPVDVDYATDGAIRNDGFKMVRPQNSVMFGSWIASESADGKDLPIAMKWQGGVAGQIYDFKQHVIPNMVCSMPEKNIKALREFAARQPNKELPKGICEKRACVLGKLAANADPGVCFRAGN